MDLVTLVASACPCRRWLPFQADENILGPKGLPDIEKTQAILWRGFGNNHYFAVGEKLGRAFSVGQNLK